MRADKDKERGKVRDREKLLLRPEVVLNRIMKNIPSDNKEADLAADLLVDIKVKEI
jgi:hypothetical protein